MLENTLELVLSVAESVSERRRLEQLAAIKEGHSTNQFEVRSHRGGGQTVSVLLTTKESAACVG